MIKICEEVDGNLYLDIVLQVKDINALQEHRLITLSVGVGIGKLHIGIKYFDEGIYERIKKENEDQKSDEGIFRGEIT